MNAPGQSGYVCLDLRFWSSEVFTFGADLGKRGLADGLPTG